MGKLNDVLQRYLSDGERFADFFNGVFFDGRKVIDAKELTESIGTIHRADGEFVF